MTSLSTLPQFSAASWTLTKAVSSAAVTSAERALWGAWIKDAVARGTLTAGEALAAIQQGRASIISLFRKHAARPPRTPCLHKSASVSTVISGSRVADPKLLRCALDFIGALANDDQVLRKELQEFTSSADLGSQLYSMGMRAWKRRCRRVIARLSADMTLFTAFEPVVSIIPMPLYGLNLALSNSQDFRTYSDDVPSYSLLLDRGDADPGLSVDPAVDPAFFAAVVRVWNAIAAAGKRSGYTTEHFNIASLRNSPRVEEMMDAVQNAQCENGQWSFRPEVREALEDIGVEFENEEAPDFLIRFANWVRTVEQIERKAPRGQFDSKQTLLLEQLIQIAAQMRKIRAPSSRTMLSDDANWCGDFRLLPTLGGDSWLIEELNEDRFMHGECDTSWVMYPQSEPNMAGLLRLADAVIVSYTLASMAAYLINAYVPQNR